MIHLAFGLRTFSESTKQPPKYAPNFKTKPNCQAFSHPKLNPVTKTTQIQPKTEEGKVETKVERKILSPPKLT